MGRRKEWTAGRRGHARPQTRRGPRPRPHRGLKQGRPLPARRIAPSSQFQGSRPADLTMDATQCHEPQSEPNDPKVALPPSPSPQPPRLTLPPPRALRPLRRDPGAHAPMPPEAKESRGCAARRPRPPLILGGRARRRRRRGCCSSIVFSPPCRLPDLVFCVEGLSVPGLNTDSTLSTLPP